MAINKTKLHSLTTQIRSMREESIDPITGTVTSRPSRSGNLMAACLGEIIDELEAIQNPIPTSILIDSITTPTSPDNPTDFTYSGGKNLIIEWENNDPGNIQYFDLRKGLNYDTADKILKTVSTRVVLEPLSAGTHYYTLKSVNSAGEESGETLTLTINITSPIAVTVTPQVIDNNILLNWTTSSSFFDIDYYKVEKGTTELGKISGTFTTIFEASAGTYSYKITPYDIYGNPGPSTTTSAAINQPPDYELESQLSDTALDGTKTRVTYDNPTRLLAPTVAETWTQHFTTSSKTSIQGFIDDANFTLFAQPSSSASDGTYVKIFDFGSVVTSMLVTTDYSYELLIAADNVIVGTTIAVSDDNITYTSPSTGTSDFVASVRYVKVTLNFNASNNRALVRFFNLRCVLETKRETDSGVIAAQSGDTGGTTVTFNKTFRDITAINTTVNYTAERHAIIDFTDAPNPTTFKVLVFDASGSRTTNNVYWMARGKT